MNTFALIGISGVGKSTFTNRLQLSAVTKIFSASNLIKLSRAESSGDIVEHDKLRLANIDNNQAHLINGFETVRADSDAQIIIEAHALIDTPSGVIEIPTNVFACLSIDHFFHLYVPAEKILEYRRGDSSRDRPRLSVEEVKNHQTRSIELTARISWELQVPMTVIGHDQSDYFRETLKHYSNRVS